MKHKLFTFLIAVMASASMSFAEIYSGSCGENLTWSLNTEDSVLTISGTGAIADFNNTSDNPWYVYRTAIKSAIIGSGVTGIGKAAFDDCSSLTSVTIPNSVTYIGDYAFRKCSSLTSVTIPNNVTSIENGAFEWCSSLTSMNIPDGVTKIGRDAFRYCNGLTSVSIPVSITQIAAYAFEGCNGLTRVNITDLTAWCNITFNGSGSNPLSDAKHLYLNDTEITNLVIPESITEIGSSTFYNCSGITSVTIPNSVTHIGEGAFSCCTGLTSLVIPNSVTRISGSAFSGCSGLTSIEIPNSVTTIGSYAFSNCYGLTSVTIPNSITRITKGAFFSCSNLISVTIPSSVTRIDESAFSKCYGLTKVNITDLAVWCNITFSALEDNPLNDARHLYLNDVEITDLVIPESVTSISNYVFYRCESLTSLTIPNSVTSIGSSAFHWCTGITSITCKAVIPPTSSPSAFQWVDKFTPLYVPAESVEAYKAADVWKEFTNILPIGSESMPYIIASGTCGAEDDNLKWTLTSDSVLTISGTGAMADYESYTATLWYSNRESIKSIVIKEGVSIIGKHAFYSLNNLTSVTIPNSVTVIGNYAFGSNVTNGCSNLTAVHISDLAAWCNIKFSASTSNPLYYAKNLYLNGTLVEELVIPDRITKINDCAFYNCGSLTSVTIPNSVTSIGKSAFSGCKGLTSVNIPNSVTTIESSAFVGCSSLNAVNISDLAAWCNISFSAASSNPLNYAKNLYLNGILVEKIVIPNGVTKINDYTFYNCSSLTSVTIPNSVTSIGNSAFYGCSSMTAVTIPSSVTTIGSSAFVGCSSLNAVNISDLAAWCNISFKASSSNPLYYAKNLYLNGTLVKDLVIPNGVTKINDYAFYNCSSLTSATIPNSVTSIGSSAFNKCSGLTSVTIPSSITTIESNAFNGCSSLTAVNISDLAAWCNINFSASTSNPLYYAKNLYLNGTLVEELVIPNGVSRINKCTFYNCSSLTSVAIPNSVTTIGSYAFSGCSGLTSVTIPNSVDSIGTNAFRECTGITSLTISNSVTTIESAAFWGCTGLTSITNLATTPQAVSTYVFGNPASNTAVDYSACTLYVPAESVEAYQTAEVWKEFTNILPIGESSDSCVIASGTCGAEGDNLTWTLSCDSVLTISGTGAMADYNSSNIPWYEYREAIRSAIIANGVTTIGTNAFYYCRELTSINIPSTVLHIRNYAFFGCQGLTSIEIPNSVTSIGDTSFDICTKLSAIIVAEDNQHYHSQDGVLFTKDATILIHCPRGKQGTYVIPNSVNSIKRLAFKGNEVLSSIEIPNSVTSIGDFAFGECKSLNLIIVAHDNSNYSSEDGVLFNKDKTTLIQYPGGKQGAYTIPNSVTSIEKYAFSGCYGITSVNIPESAINIGSEAFRSCNGLTSIIIGNSIANIEDYAFAYCNRLTTVTNYATTPQVINANVFNGVNKSTCMLYVPAKSIAAYQAADVWKEFGNILAIEDEPAPCILASGTCGAQGDNLTWELSCDSVLTISGTGEMTNYISGSDAPWFEVSAAIKSVIVAEGVTSIGRSAFRNCTGLTSVTIPNSVTSIGDYAFYYCTSLTSVTIPNSVTSIGDQAFRKCSSLTSVTIPNSVTSIGSGAFVGCTGLTSVTIPNSVTSIEEGAFSGCTGLTSVTIPNSVTSIEYGAFSYCSGLISVTIPNSVTSIGNDAFEWCTGLTSINVASNNSNYCSVDGVLFNKDKTTLIQYPGGKQGAYTIPNSVTSIGEGAFSGCTGLTSVTIPNSVTSIGLRAFYNCTGLTSLTCEATTPPTLGSNVFLVVNTSIPLYVSAESVALYKAADQWKDFTNILPIEETPGTCITASGTCGENLTWELSCDSVLTISGTGKMADFSSSLEQSWYAYSEAIKSVIIGNGVTSIGRLAFYGFISLTSIEIPNSVTSIGEYAFGYCSMGSSCSMYSVTIPNSVTSIGNYAFFGCHSLTSVTIPNSVTSIGNCAFAFCSGLTAINVDTDNPKYTSIDGVLFNNNKKLLKQYPGGRQGTYTIPSSVTNIGTAAFAYSKSLTSIEIPNSVTSIGEYAFWETRGLTSVTIPNSVINIGEYAFANFRSLTSVTNYATAPQAIDANVFDNVDKSACTLNVPAQSLATYQSADVWKDFGNILAIEGSTPSHEIDRTGTCGDNMALTWTYDPGTKTLTISGNGTLNSNYTFGPEAPAEIEQLIIAEGVTSIGDSAFRNMSTLQTMQLPSSLKTIGAKAFENCIDLSSIYNYRERPCLVNATAFDGVNKFDCTLYVLEGSVDMYKSSISDWRDFYFILPISTTTVTEPVSDVIVEPHDNAATVTWPTQDNAVTYAIEISKDGVVFCRLTFNANGQLTGIAFAPGRDGSHNAPAALMTVNGLQFTITGLNSNTKYSYSITAKDDNDVPVATYSGEFFTTGEGIATAVDNTTADSKATKLLLNGQILILRGEKEYTIMGQKVK